MTEEPPYLTVGTEVSAKYKGAFCEAKIKKVVRTVKCKVTFKSGLGSTLLSDDNIKGPLRVGSNVEARHPDKNLFIEATINKIQDCSQYTVVFDDGDITTLKRSALVLKSGRHFNESETLDQLPLTHPEHFSNPVVAGRRNVRKKSGDGDDSSDEEDAPVKKGKKKAARGDVDIGKVVCVEVTDKKKSKDNWFPALIVTPSAQETVKIRTKDEYLVRSFRDGRYYTVPKKEITDFTKDVAAKVESSSNVLKTALDKAIQYLEKNELPPHWDKDVLFASVPVSFGAEPEVEEEDEVSESSEESDEDILGEEKDRFVAQLYKFMEDRGTPINKVPIVCNKDLDLYKLYKIVSGKGGYNKVTNSSQWKPVTVKMGFGSMPTTSTINLVKQAYKKFIHNFEEFFRKLGCSLNPLSSSTKSRSNRSIFRDRHASSSSKELKKEEPKVVPLKEVKSDLDDKTKKAVITIEPIAEASPAVSDIVKIETIDEPPRRSRSRLENRSKKDAEESPEKSSVKPPEKLTTKSAEKSPPKSQEKSPSKSPEKSSVKPAEKPADKPEKTLGKKRRSLVKEKAKDKEVHLKVAEEPEPPPPTPPPPPPAVAGGSVPKKGVGRGKYKRKSDKDPPPEPEIETPIEEEIIPDHIGKEVMVLVGDKLQVYYGPKSDGKVTYDAKVIDLDDKKQVFLVHYTGWNTRYDEWIPRTRISENSSLRTDQVVCPPQGRGPGQSSVSDSAASSDAGSVSKESTTPKGVKKKARPSVLPPSTTRSKSGIATRKRLSSEGDAISTKRKTRKRAVLSGAESGEDSSDSESTKTPVGLLIRSPRSTKSVKSVDIPGSSSASGGSFPEVLSETETTDKQSQVIDLNLIRSELKGLDKVLKVDSPPSTSQAQSEVKTDVYEFEEDINDAPKLKVFTPRSPDKKDEVPTKSADPAVDVVNSEPSPALIEPTTTEDKVKVPTTETKAEILQEHGSTTASVTVPVPTQPAIEPVAPPAEVALGPSCLADEPKLKHTTVPALPQLLVRGPVPVLHTQPPPLIPIVPPALVAKLPNKGHDSPNTIPSASPLPTLTQRPTLPILMPVPVVCSSVPPLIHQMPVTPLVGSKIVERANVKPDDVKPESVQEVAREPDRPVASLKVQVLKREPPASSFPSTTSVESKTPLTSKLQSRLIPVAVLESDTKSVSTDITVIKQSPAPILLKPNPINIGAARSGSSTTISVASVTTSAPNKPETINAKKKKKVISKNIFEPSVGVGASYGTPAIIQPVKRPNESTSKTPAKKPKKAVSVQSTKFQPIIPQVPKLLAHIAPASVQPLSVTSPPILKLPLSQDFQPPVGLSTIIVAPVKTPIKATTSAEKKVVQLKKPATVFKKVNMGKPIAPATPTIPTPGKVSTAALIKSLVTPKKIIQKTIKQPGKASKVTLPSVATANTSVQNTIVSKKGTSFSSTVKAITIPATVPILPPIVAASVAPNPVVLPKSEERRVVPIEIKAVAEDVPAFAMIGKAKETLEKPKEIVTVENQELCKDVVVERKNVSLLLEEESCHSLLCAEEIPGSPPPSGTGSDRFGFEDETARHHSPTPPVPSKDEQKISGAVQLPITFTSICTKSADIPTEVGIKAVKEEQYNIPPKTLLEPLIKELPNISLPTNLPPLQPELEDEFLKDEQHSDHRSGPSTAYQSPHHAIDNSPPTTPESSTSLSSGSPRGDGGRMSPIGDNSNKAQPSDTDSMDCLNKPGDIADDNSNSSDTSRRFGNNPSSPSSKNTSSTHDKGQRDDSPPGKRRRVMRRKSPDETVRSYRGGRHSTGRRMTGGSGGNDPDSGRMPPPHPPINLGKPPRSDKFNFIPVLTDDMEPEDRIAIIQSCMTDLKLRYMATKSSLMLVERRKKRLKKREREREKEILKTLSQDSEDEKHDILGMR